MAKSTVTKTIDDTEEGSLRAAIASAGDGDTIVFDSSLNGETILLTAELDFGTFGGTTLTIQGPGSNLLTVSGTSSSRVFYNPSGKIITISGLTVTGGNGVGTASGSGGGIYNLGTLTLTDLQVITNSSTTQGGGIYNIGTFTLNNSLVKKNTSSFGGGIANSSDNLGIPVILNNSKITENTANTSGGGIITGNPVGGPPTIGNLTLNNMIVSNNSATNFGGGIYVNPRNLVTINNSIISGNNSLDGGGIYNHSAPSLGHNQTVNLNYSILLTNVASGTGGAIYNVSGISTAIVNLTNTTVTGNSAATTGGIRTPVPILPDAGKLTLTSSKIDGNVNSDISGPYTSSPVGSNYVSGNSS